MDLLRQVWQDPNRRGAVGAVGRQERNIIAGAHRLQSS